jgi:RNA recognition motif-containing protein
MTDKQLFETLFKDDDPFSSRSESFPFVGTASSRLTTFSSLLKDSDRNEHILDGKSLHTEASKPDRPTRHARRLYFGGFSRDDVDSKLFVSALNGVICRALSEDINDTHILSIHMDTEKGYAFVEFDTIALTSACLGLDNFIYRSSVLRVRRVKEYRADLVISSSQALSLDFSSVTRQKFFNVSSVPSSIISTRASSESDETPLGSILKSASFTDVEPGAIVLVGFPYAPDGSVSTAKLLAIFRSRLQKLNVSLNPEFEVNISTTLCIQDAGDIPKGLSPDEASMVLSATVNQIIKRKGIPFVIGGPRSQLFHIAVGINGASETLVSVLKVATSLKESPTCQDCFSKCGVISMLNDSVYGGTFTNRCTIFGLQGHMSHPRAISVVREKGASVQWLSKDIRNLSNVESSALAVSKLECCLQNLSMNGGNDIVHASFDLEAFSSCEHRDCTKPTGSMGFSESELMSFAFLCGKNLQVLSLDFSTFSVDETNPKNGNLLVEAFHYFLLGRATSKAV